jgi:hypothetical protein
MIQLCAACRPVRKRGSSDAYHVIKDNQYVYSTSPGKAAVNFTWRNSSPAAGKTSYYYVRGEQLDGEIVWVSPM